MSMLYWDKSINHDYDACSTDALSMYFTERDYPRIMAAIRAVSRQANWYPEQGGLLRRLTVERDSTAIREWATEMREEMPDNDAWPQDFCDDVAEAMDELAQIIEGASKPTD